MSANSNPDPELRELVKRLRETRERIIGGLSEQLLDPTLSGSKRAQLEKHLSELKKRQEDDE